MTDLARRFHEYFPQATYDRRSLHGQVANQLGLAILGGEFAAGAVLPKEDALSARFRVSRTATREAIKVLAAKGLIETRTKSGSRVRDRRLWNMMDPDVLMWHFAARSDGPFVRDLIELRQIIEPSAARLAAKRATAADLERIEAACARMAGDTGDDVGFLEADLAFHNAVLAATHNQALVQQAHTVSAALLAAFARSTEQAGAMAAALPLHQAVYQAIRQRHPDLAAEAMAVCVRQDDAAEPAAVPRAAVEPDQGAPADGS